MLNIFFIKKLLNFFKIIFCFSIFLSTHFIYAHIWKITQLSNGAQTIYIFFDYFCDKNYINIEQKKDFTELALSLNAAAIIEDSISLEEKSLIEKQNPHFLSFFDLVLLRENFPCVAGLASYCNIAGVPVYNAEFREQLIHELPRNYLWAFAHIKAQLDYLEEEILKYNDSAVFTKVYTELLEKYRRRIKHFKEFFLSEIHNNYSSEKMIELLYEQLFLSDEVLLPLVDIRILHGIKQFSHHSTIFIAAGYCNAQDVQEYLVRKLGYLCLDTIIYDKKLFDADEEPVPLLIKETFKDSFNIQGVKLNKISLLTILIKIVFWIKIFLGICLLFFIGILFISLAQKIIRYFFP